MAFRLRLGDRRAAVRLGDRRGAVRFDVGGQIWGTLEMMEPLPMRNIGRGGVLVEAELPLTVDSFHRMHLVLHDHESIVEGRVRHVKGIPAAAGGDRQLIGFEFVSVDSVTLEYIDHLVAAGGGSLPT